MLSVILYHHSSNVKELDFLKSPERPVQVICPNPIVADGVRASLPESGPFPSIDVMTVSRFISSAFKDLSIEKNVARKAEILKVLAVAWKKFNPNLPTQSFLQAYQHLTDLRSFTLDSGLVEEALSDYGEEMSRLVLRFWKLLEQMDITDEQAAYAELAKALRENQADYKNENQLSSQSLIFWGFDFFNAGQVDLLKALSLRNDVYCPVPKIAYDKAISSDWVKWLDENVEMIDEPLREAHIHIHYFKKNRLSETLPKIFTGKSQKQIFLAEKNPTIHQVGEISLSNSHFKTSNNVFQNEVRQLDEHLKDILGEETKPLDEILNAVQQEMTTLQGGREQKFLKLKVYSSFYLLLQEWGDLSEINKKFNTFDLDILIEVLSLNLPRNFWTPLNDVGEESSIKGLESLETFNHEKEALVVARVDYMSLKSSEDRYSERMIELLLAIAPVPRKEFEFQFLKQRLQEVLTSSKTSLLLEAGLDSEDQSWQEILKDADCHRETLEVSGDRKQRDYLKEDIQKTGNCGELKKISATRLQTFMDCPRKYFYHYIHSLDVDVAGESEVRARDLGSLEHKCLENYFELWKKGKDKIDLDDIVTQCFRSFLQKQQKKLSQRDYAKYRTDIYHAVKKGVDAILSLPDLSRDDLYFEYSLDKSSELRGSIDCLGSCAWGNFLFDFKRSVSSIPSATEVKNYESIQTWFYLYGLKELFSERTFDFWGYLNIAEPKSSLIFCVTKELSKELKSAKLFDGTSVQSIDDLSICLTDFENLLTQNKRAMREEVSFPPKPRKNDICQFCGVKNLCPRMESET